jgi:hypothetical protein
MLASKEVIGAAPDFPAASASHVSGSVFPSGLTAPAPVITIRLRINHSPLHFQYYLWQMVKGGHKPALLFLFITHFL